MMMLAACCVGGAPGGGMTWRRLPYSYIFETQKGSTRGCFAVTIWRLSFRVILLLLLFNLFPEENKETPKKLCYAVLLCT